MIDIRLALTDSPPPGDIPIKIRCRWSTGDSDPSMCVYPDHIHCFHCGRHITTPETCINILLGHDDGRDMKKFTTNATSLRQNTIERGAVLDPLPWQLAVVYHDFLMTGRRKHRKHWFYDRGLTDETIGWYCLGHDGNSFTIPIYSDKNELITFRYRRDDAYGTLDYHENEIPKYYGIRGRNGNFLYPSWELAEDMSDYVVVCEGELDALRLRQEGINAISPTNGAGAFKFVPSLLSPYEHIKRVYIASDMDEAGEEAAQQFLRAWCGRGHIQLVQRLTWDKKYKDVTDLYLAGEELEL